MEILRVLLPAGAPSSELQRLPAGIWPENAIDAAVIPTALSTTKTLYCPASPNNFLNSEVNGYATCLAGHTVRGDVVVELRANSASGVEEAFLELQQAVQRYTGVTRAFPRMAPQPLGDFRTCTNRGVDDGVCGEHIEANRLLRRKPGHVGDGSSCSGPWSQADWEAARRAPGSASAWEGGGMHSRVWSPTKPSRSGFGRDDAQAGPTTQEPPAGQNRGNAYSCSGAQGPLLSARNKPLVQAPRHNPRCLPNGSGAPHHEDLSSRAALMDEFEPRARLLWMTIGKVTGFGAAGQTSRPTPSPISSPIIGSGAAAQTSHPAPMTGSSPILGLASDGESWSSPMSKTGSWAGFRPASTSAVQAPGNEEGVTASCDVKVPDEGTFTSPGHSAGWFGRAGRAEQEEVKQPVAAPWADLPPELLNAVLEAGGYGIQLALKMAQTCRTWRRAISTDDRCLSALVFPIPEIAERLWYRFCAEDSRLCALQEVGIVRCEVRRAVVPYIVHMAALNNNVNACVSTARILMNAHDDEGALRYYERAAYLQIPEAQVHLANAYYLGCLGKQANLEEALSLFSRAANRIMDSNGVKLPPTPNDLKIGYFNICPLDNWLLGRSAIILAHSHEDGQTGFLGGNSDEQLRKSIYWLKVAACTKWGTHSLDAKQQLHRLWSTGVYA